MHSPKSSNPRKQKRQSPGNQEIQKSLGSQAQEQTAADTQLNGWCNTERRNYRSIYRHTLMGGFNIGV